MCIRDRTISLPRAPESLATPQTPTEGVPMATREESTLSQSHTISLCHIISLHNKQPCSSSFSHYCQTLWNTAEHMCNTNENFVSLATRCFVHCASASHCSKTIVRFVLVNLHSPYYSIYIGFLEEKHFIPVNISLTVKFIRKIANFIKQ